MWSRHRRILLPVNFSSKWHASMRSELSFQPGSSIGSGWSRALAFPENPALRLKPFEPLTNSSGEVESSTHACETSPAPCPSNENRTPQYKGKQAYCRVGCTLEAKRLFAASRPPVLPGFP